MLTMVYPSPPAILDTLEAETRAIHFAMASDALTGALLRSLAASKPAGRLLELGTGTGLATAWMLDGMDRYATLLTVDTDEQAAMIAQRHLSGDSRVTFIIEDGGTVIERLQHEGQRFDLIFADTWPGKFYLLNETLALLAEGGLYIIDDLLPQPNWPEGHGKQVTTLITHLQQRPNVKVTPLSWSTGIMIVTKTADQE